MLQAMNTGHPGSLSTGHGNSPQDMLSRLEVIGAYGSRAAFRCDPQPDRVGP